MSRCRLLLLLLVATLALPACYYSRRSGDLEREPTVDTGMGAAIILPGQTAPELDPKCAAGGTTQTRVGAEGASGSVSGCSQPSTGKLTAIGSSKIDKDRHFEGKEDPLILKVLTAPLALIAAPFVFAADAVRGEDQAGPPVPQSHPQAPPPESAPAIDYEAQELAEMEAELARRSAPTPSSSAGPHPAPRPSAPRASPTSIADELAALQRAPRRATSASAPTPVETRVEAPVTTAVRDPEAVADGIVDRNGDGRVDLWLYREDGEIVRKVADADFDGRPDTTLHYDRETHALARVEEDGNRDGRTDSWTEYRAGAVVRSRTDANHDGQIDSWMYYGPEGLRRHEQDTTGDGFRDRIGSYEAGRLVREERDRDADGRADVVIDYDDQERVKLREEDLDGDGVVDVISHYEEGRLARKELLGDPSTVTP